MKNEMTNLIDEYIQCANYSIKLLKTIYRGDEELLRAKVLKLIPKDGYIDETFYSFHGRGCFFKYQNDEIDIDFGPGGRNDGFDEYRLRRFLEYRKQRYKEITNDETFKSQYRNLIDFGIIKKYPEDTDDHLYYLSNSLS